MLRRSGSLDPVLSVANDLPAKREIENHDIKLKHRPLHATAA
jgi:hypothetical protein